MNSVRQKDEISFNSLRAAPNFQLEVGILQPVYCGQLALANLAFVVGFKNLTPMFTVVCKPSEPPYTSDDFLVSVMTCANYVKLPDYSTIHILRKRLLTAIHEGQGAFHLS